MSSTLLFHFRSEENVRPRWLWTLTDSKLAPEKDNGIGTAVVGRKESFSDTKSYKPLFGPGINTDEISVQDFVSVV